MKKLLYFCIPFVCVLLFCSAFKQTKSNLIPYKFAAVDSIKLKAFDVLVNNCNECHTDKKPAYIFTLANMNEYAADINTQVFLKRKMPKGKKNVLTAEDENTLKVWVEDYFKKLKENR